MLSEAWSVDVERASSPEGNYANQIALNLCDKRVKSTSSKTVCVVLHRGSVIYHINELCVNWFRSKN